MRFPKNQKEYIKFLSEVTFKLSNHPHDEDAKEGIKEVAIEITMNAAHEEEGRDAQLATLTACMEIAETTTRTTDPEETTEAIPEIQGPEDTKSAAE